MAKLTAKTRNALGSQEFAGPHRSYPVPDKAHAANAKARVANKSPALKARVDAKANKVLHADTGSSNVVTPQSSQTSGTWTPPQPSAGTTSGVRSLTGMTGVPRPAPPPPATRGYSRGTSDACSGMESAMAAHADKLHPVRMRR